MLFMLSARAAPGRMGSVGLFLLRSLALALVALAPVSDTSRPSAVRLGRGRAFGARASALKMPPRPSPSARRLRGAGAAKRSRSCEHAVEDAAEEATSRTPRRRRRLGDWGGSDTKIDVECVMQAEKRATVAASPQPAWNRPPVDVIPGEAMCAETVCVVTPDGKSYTVRVRRQEALGPAPSTAPHAITLLPQIEDSRTQEADDSSSQTRAAGISRRDGGLAALVDSIEREMQDMLQARRCPAPQLRSLAPPPPPPALDDTGAERRRRAVSGKRQRGEVLRGGGAAGGGSCAAESGAGRLQRGREARSRRGKGLKGASKRLQRHAGVVLAGDRGGGGKTRGKRACLGFERGGGAEHIVTVPEHVREQLRGGEREWEASGEEDSQVVLEAGRAARGQQPAGLRAVLLDAAPPDARGSVRWSSEARAVMGGLGDTALGGIVDGGTCAGGGGESSSDPSSEEVLGGEEEDGAEMARGGGGLAGALSRWRPNGCGGAGQGGLPWLV